MPKPQPGSSRVRRLVNPSPRWWSICITPKGYDSDAIRHDLRGSGATPEIPTKSNRKVQYSVSKPLYASRSRIECFIGHLKEQRRIATRYHKLATSFIGFVLLGCIRIWARFVHRA